MKRILALVSLSIVLSITVSLLVATAVKIAPHLARGEDEGATPQA